MPPRNVGRWTAMGFALTLMVLLGGCRWLPIRRPEATLDPRRLSAERSEAEPAPVLPLAVRSAAEEARARVPLPVLPLRAISDAEALADNPPAATPLLDDALARAEEIQAVTVSDFETPEKPPFSPPGSSEPPVTVELPSQPQVATRDEEVRLTIFAPDRAGGEPPAESIEPEAVGVGSGASPEASWRTALESLRKLAHEQVQAGNDASGAWSAREQVLSRLAELADASRIDPDQILWRTAATILARAETEAGEAVEVESEAVEPEKPTPEMATEPELAIVGLCLCRKVEGFGMYEPADPNAIQAGRTVTLYWEVEGLQADTVDSYFRTRLASSVAILPGDAREGAGEPLWSRSLGNADDLCRRRRRDYFVNSRLTLPESLGPGRYQLRLTLEDRNAGRSTTQTIPLTIKP